MAHGNSVESDGAVCAGHKLMLARAEFWTAVGVIISTGAIACAVFGSGVADKLRAQEARVDREVIVRDAQRAEIMAAIREMRAESREEFRVLRERLDKK